MALDEKGAEHTGQYAHEGLTPPSEIPRKPIEKDSSDSTISKGSAQNGIAPVKGSPLGRYTRIHERRMLYSLPVYHAVDTLRIYDAAMASLEAQSHIAIPMQIWDMGVLMDGAWVGHVQRELLHLLSGQREAHLAGTVPALLEGCHPLSCP